MLLLNKIRNSLILFYLELKNRLSSSFGINKIAHNNNIIVSMTTYSKRLDIVHLTLETILSQTVKPNKILLYISSDDLPIDRTLPKKITRLKKRGLTIIFVEENIYSYKKLIYTIEKYPNDILITIDDDTLYPRSFIENLIKKYKKFPTSIIAYRCTVIEFEGNKLKPYLSWKAAQNIETPSLLLFPTGVGGILYPPQSLNSLVLDKNIFMKLAPTADDVWFKAMALLNGTKVITVFTNMVEFKTINGSQDDALWQINNDLGNNDQQIKAVFDSLHIYKYLDRRNCE